MSNKRVLALVVAATLAELIGALVVFYEGRLLSEVEVAKLLLVVAGIMCTVAITELIPSGLNSSWKSRRWNAANRGLNLKCIKSISGRKLQLKGERELLSTSECWCGS
jgi:hypothetical protein